MPFNQKLIKGLAASLFTIIAFSSQADSYNISFDESGLHGPTSTQNYGTIIDDEYGSSGVANLGGIDVNFWAQSSWDENNASFNSNQSDLFVTLFNSSADFQTQDPDLIVGKDNIAVIHERNADCSLATNSCNDPDDRYLNGTPHGGYVFVEFSEPVAVHSLDLVDIEAGDHQRGKIAFFDSANKIVGNWSDMVVTGNGGTENQTFNTANTISYMVIKMQGSGGFKNLAFSTPTDIPEPSTIALLGLALVFAARRNKQR